MKIFHYIIYQILNQCVYNLYRNLFIFIVLLLVLTIFDYILYGALELLKSF